MLTWYLWRVCHGRYVEFVKVRFSPCSVLLIFSKVLNVTLTVVWPALFSPELLPFVILICRRQLVCLGSQNFTVNCVKGHNFVFNWNMQAVHKAETRTKLSLLVYWQLKKSMIADPQMISMSPSYPTLNWVLRFFLQRYTCIRNACLVVCC